MIRDMITCPQDLVPAGVQPEVLTRQIERYRRMSYEEKLRLADDLYRLAWEMTCAGVRLREPACDESEVRRRARAILRAAAD
ncbi:hypothetical protein [Gemmatimonas aurantiaca]|uniref:hypothetical protein n=1 Tax=Gemmatimonas aurantiaca TaxID=173480 RepID=UPI00301D8970